jgi:hypothetical protein
LSFPRPRAFGFSLVAWWFAAPVLVSTSEFARADEYPIAPYTDPAQLDCPWPKHSHYLQPWRGYIETKSGWDFLNGFGINLQIPDGHEELAIRLLAETGFRACRIEVGFGASQWDESPIDRRRKSPWPVRALREIRIASDHPDQCASRTAVPGEIFQNAG